MATAKARSKKARADSKPRQDFVAIPQLGLKAQALAQQHAAAIGTRLPAAFLTALGAVVPAAITSRHGAVQSAAAQNAAVRAEFEALRSKKTT